MVVCETPFRCSEMKPVLQHLATSRGGKQRWGGAARWSSLGIHEEAFITSLTPVNWSVWLQRGLVSLQELRSYVVEYINIEKWYMEILYVWKCGRLLVVGFTIHLNHSLQVQPFIFISQNMVDLIIIISYFTTTPYTQSPAQNGTFSVHCLDCQGSNYHLV